MEFWQLLSAFSGETVTHFGRLSFLQTTDYSIQLLIF